MNWTELESQARAWMAQDPDPTTRAELEALLALGPEAAPQLSERFAGPLAFGTAGLRGLLGAGESRMNRAVVIRTAHGLGASLLEHDSERARAQGVAIGYDGRRLSREFAEDSAAVLAAQGIPVHLFPGLCPTPLLCYAARVLECAAGVMVTASHNPPDYNGYKVYARNSAQIVPPQDRHIATAIAAAPPATEVPRLELAEARERGLVHTVGPEVADGYHQAIAGLSLRSDGERSLPIVYTPLHGVGWEDLRRALEAAGFSALQVVAEQAQPDGRFPTVEFPNPEEPGAMDLSLALAEQTGAPLILANDPDADRLAVALRDGSGRFVQLTGNEVGVLLGHYLLTEGRAGERPRLVMASCVSSPQLGAIAAELGARYEETLTGFKWIANRAVELADEAEFVFGYEEALGYTVGTVVRDKDGISAALLIAELAAARASEGQTLLDELAAIARRFGLYVSGQRSVRFPAAEGGGRMAAIMERLRGDPPQVIGGLAVEAVRDYQASVRTAADGSREALTLPKSNVLAFELAGGNRIIARPSGTEPKIKYYFDLREPMEAGESYAEAKARAEEKREALADAFVALLEE